MLTKLATPKYHGFYKEPIQWIGTAVEEGVQALNGKYPLYAGLYLPDFRDLNELKQGIIWAKEKGAAGVSLFGETEFDTQTIQLLKEIK